MSTRFSALVIFLSVIYSTCIWAVPAAPLELELTQPDGTIFTAFPRGDEYANWIETSGGHTIINHNGTWFYAEKDNAGALRATGVRVGSLNDVELQSLPVHLAPTPDPQAFAATTLRKISRGDSINNQDFAQALAVSHTQYVLTVLVDYTDQSFTYSDANFQSLIYGASNSVRDFFLENSYDGFTVTAATESQGTGNDGIIHVSRATNHPDQGGDSSASRVEARAVVSLVDSYIDFSAYDANGNGTVSEDELSIVIILAGYETSYGGEGVALTPNVWGHQWSFDSTLTLDGVDLRPYTMFGEAHATNGGNEHQATMGIMCHELGHLMLGLPDLYDSDGSSAGIGDWGLMGGGSWNVESGWSGTSPSHLSAWSKVATGLTLATDIDTDQSSVSFTKADSNEDAKRIWIDKYKSEASYEYFLVENRQLSGYDAGLPASGLMVWHIDENRSNNRNESHKWVDVEAADGLTHLDLDTNSGDTGDPFPGVTNNTIFNDTSAPDSKRYAGTSTGIGVTGISVSGATMTADISALTGGVGDHVRYDENGAILSAGLGSQTIWVGIRALNDTANTNFDGIDVFVWDGSFGTGATIDIYYYSSLAGGNPTGLIHSETGIAAGTGWNRLLLTTPQSFPIGTERGVVIKIVNNNGNFPLVYDSIGVNSGRSYYDSDGTSTFNSFSSDISLVALLSGSADPAPTATIITPSTSGPTNANSVSFDISFSEDVINFNDSADVTISHSGTSHGGVSITGSGSSYSADVTGVAGDGSFTLTVDTGSDVEDSSGNALSSSVTSSSVSIDNTAPELTIGAPSASSATTGPVSYTVTYLEADVVSLADENVILNSTGTADGTVAVSGTGTSSRTVTISSISGDGSLGISIGSGTASDGASNLAGGAGPSGTFSVDNSDPAATVITPSSTGPTSSDSVSFDITFSEDVVNFNDQADVTISHSDTSHSGVNITGSGSSYSAEVTGIDGTGSFTLTVNTGSDVEDVVMNALASSVTSAPVDIDNTNPSATTITPSTTGPTNVDAVSFDITFSEDVVNFDDPADVSIIHSGTSHSSVIITGSGSSYSVDVSGIAGDGSFTLAVNTDSDVEDVVTNALASGVTSDPVSIDNIPPAVSIGVASIDSTMRGPVSYTVSYVDADSISLAADDVSLDKTGTANGDIAISGSGTSTRTVTINYISGDGSLGISIASGTADDEAGNEAAATGPSGTFSVIFVEKIFGDSFESP